VAQARREGARAPEHALPVAQARGEGARAPEHALPVAQAREEGARAPEHALPVAQARREGARAPEHALPVAQAREEGARAPEHALPVAQARGEGARALEHALPVAQARREGARAPEHALPVALERSALDQCCRPFSVRMSVAAASRDAFSSGGSGRDAGTGGSAGCARLREAARGSAPVGGVPCHQRWQQQLEWQHRWLPGRPGMETRRPLPAAKGCEGERSRALQQRLALVEARRSAVGSAQISRRRRFVP
jgi:hypothetical protein